MTNSTPQPLFEEWLENFIQKLAPLERAYAESYWKAQTTGNKEAVEVLQAAEKTYRKIFQDANSFEYLSSLHKNNSIKNEATLRQLDILKREFEENQMPEETLSCLVDLQVEIESEFNNFRAKLGGNREVTDNQLRDILRDSTDSTEVHEAWEASKQIGPRVADRILELVKIRNQVARNLGYENHQVFSLSLSELDATYLFELFNELESLTEEPFKEVKASLDKELALRFGLDPISGRDELLPWHYGDPFFQASPVIGDVNLDSFYKGQDLVKLTKDFYNGIRLDIHDLLERSDLFERPGKCQHAFCMDVDRNGDVRVLCNLKSNEKWMGTMLHEFGHAVYDKYFEPDMPHILRGPTHTFVTEAIAMLFGRLSQNKVFLNEVVGVNPQEAENASQAAREELRRNQLIFIRWGLVMVHFEKELYNDPTQDLDTLWWDLVERIQHIRRPSGRKQPDWATKIHIATAPVYYQNYILGELTASQFQACLLKKISGNGEPDLGNLINRSETGEFLREEIFMPGRLYPWYKLIKKATGGTPPAILFPGRICEVLESLDAAFISRSTLQFSSLPLSSITPDRHLG